MAQKSVKNGQNWGLILSGEGEQKKQLIQTLSNLQTSAVFFLEPCEWYEVPIRYTLADVAVLPSLYEPFGFLVNESMVYSMPVLVSDRCGSAKDLVIDGYNGFQFDPYSQDDLLNKMTILMNETHRHHDWGTNGKRIIDEWSPDIIVDELIKSFLNIKPK